MPVIGTAYYRLTWIWAWCFTSINWCFMLQWTQAIEWQLWSDSAHFYFIDLYQCVVKPRDNAVKCIVWCFISLEYLASSFDHFYWWKWHQSLVRCSVKDMQASIPEAPFSHYLEEFLLKLPVKCFRYSVLKLCLFHQLCWIVVIPKQGWQRLLVSDW